MRIRTHTNPFYCRQRFKNLKALIDPAQYTGIDFEIGFGQGTFIFDYARQHPNRLIVGAEVRKKTVELLQKKIDTHKLENILALHGNGHICLEDMFGNNSIDNIFIFHPDPWMKRRHNNRRVINLDFVSHAHKKLKKTGKLYISTDVKLLWEYMLETITYSGKFTRTQNSEFWENFYSTRWTDMCREKQRTIFYGTFAPI